MLQYQKNTLYFFSWPSVHAYGWPSACVPLNIRGGTQTKGIIAKKED